VAFVPLWFQVYQAAGENPLEAQRMMDDLTGEWWQYHVIAQQQKAKVNKS
jgi:hypothetical protein